MTWTFEVVPQTNLQSFRTTIRSENGWLPITLTSSTSMIPGNTPPAQISTRASTLPTRMPWDIRELRDRRGPQHSGQHHRVDCPVPFTGSVTLTKE